MNKYHKRVKEERNILHKIKEGNANWIAHILCRNCLLQHVTEGKIEERQKGREQEEEDPRICCTNLRNGKILETESESTRSHGLENAVWNRRWTCRKKDYVMKIQACTHS